MNGSKQHGRWFIGWQGYVALVAKHRCLTMLSRFVDPKKDFHFSYHTKDVARANYLSGWCLAAKKSEFDKLIVETNEYKGPWNEGFFAYFEDALMGFQARYLGFSFRILPVPIHHFENVSSKELSLKKLYHQSHPIFKQLVKAYL